MLTQGAGLYRPQASLARQGGRLRNWGRLSVARLQLKDMPDPAWAAPTPTPPHLTLTRGKLKLAKEPIASQVYQPPNAQTLTGHRPSQPC